jgi:hypothetical protein
MPGLAEELPPFKRAAMKTCELAVDFVLFFRNFLKWVLLGSGRFIFIDGSNTRKVKTTSKFINGRRHVTLNCSEPFHKLNVLILN